MARPKRVPWLKMSARDRGAMMVQYLWRFKGVDRSLKDCANAWVKMGGSDVDECECC